MPLIRFDLNYVFFYISCKKIGGKQVNKKKEKKANNYEFCIELVARKFSLFFSNLRLISWPHFFYRCVVVVYIYLNLLRKYWLWNNPNGDFLSGSCSNWKCLSGNQSSKLGRETSDNRSVDSSSYNWPFSFYYWTHLNRIYVNREIIGINTEFLLTEGKSAYIYINILIATTQCRNLKV